MISSANLSTMLVLPISTVTSAPRLLGFDRCRVEDMGHCILPGGDSAAPSLLPVGASSLLDKNPCGLASLGTCHSYTISPTPDEENGAMTCGVIIAFGKAQWPGLVRGHRATTQVGASKNYLRAY